MHKPWNTQINTMNSWVLSPTSNEKIIYIATAVHGTINRCIKHLQSQNRADKLKHISDIKTKN